MQGPEAVKAGGPETSERTLSQVIDRLPARAIGESGPLELGTLLDDELPSLDLPGIENQASERLPRIAEENGAGHSHGMVGS